MADDYYSWNARRAGLDKPKEEEKPKAEPDTIEPPADLSKDEGMIVEESTATTGIMQKINEFWKGKV